MSAQQVIEHMMHRAIFANQVMRTDLGAGKRKSLKRLLTTVLGGMMKDYIVGSAHRKIGSSDKAGAITNRILQRILPKQS